MVIKGTTNNSKIENVVISINPKKAKRYQFS